MLARINRNYVPSYWDDFFNWSQNGLNNGSTNGSTPAVNVLEEDKEYRIEVAVPGMSKKDIRVDVEEDVLTVSSEQKENREENKTSFRKREFYFSSFKRSFQLPDTVHQEGIKANHENGVLTIHLPKKEETIQKAPKKISIS